MADDPKVTVGGDTSGAQKALDALNDKIKGIQESLKSFGESAEHTGHVIENAIGFEILKEKAGEVKEAMDEAVKSFANAEQAGLSLGASLRNQGIATDEVKAHYKELAEAQAERSKYTVTEITQSEAIIQNYLGQTQVTEGLLRATANLAAGKRIDLLSASELVGKAIGGETNALARYGIEISKTGTEQEKMVELTAELQRLFAGQAKVQTEGLGALNQTKKSYEELQIAVGEKLAPSILRIDGIFKGIYDTIRHNDALVTTIAIAGSLAAGMLTLTTALIGVTLAIPAFTAAISLAGTGLSIVAAFFVANPIGLGLIALAAATATFAVAWNKDFGGIKEKTAGTMAAVRAELEQTVAEWKAYGKIALGVLALPSDMGTTLKAGIKDFEKAQKDSIGVVSGAYQMAYDAEVEHLKNIAAKKQADADKEKEQVEAGAADKARKRRAEIEDENKAFELHQKNAEAMAKAEIARIDAEEIKRGQSDDAIEAARDKQLALAEKLYYFELDHIKSSQAGALESIELQKQALIELQNRKEKILEAADKAERDRGDRLQERQEKATQASYKSGVDAIEKIQIKQATSQEQVDIGLKAQLDLEAVRFKTALANINSLDISQEEADARKEQAEANYQEQVLNDQEKAAAKKKELQDKANTDNIAAVKTVADEGLKGVAGVAVRAVGTAMGGPVVGEIFGQLFDKLSQSRDKFKAYMASLVDTSFIENILANIGAAIGKAASLRGFRDFVAGIRDGVINGFEEAFESIGDGFRSTVAGNFFSIGPDIDAAKEKLKTIGPVIESLQKQAADLTHQILVDGLKADVDAANTAVQEASKNRQDIETQLADALKKQQDQNNQAILDSLKARLATEQELLNKAQADQVKAQNDLNTLLKQKEDQKKTDSEKKSADATKDQQFILDRDTQALTSLQQDKLATQDDLQHAHDQAEIDKLQAHLDEINGKLGEAQDRQLAAKVAFDSAKKAADDAAGVVAAKSLDDQIAAAQKKLDDANAAVVSAAKTVADDKAKIAAIEAAQEEVITGAKIADLNAKLNQSVADEATARAKLAEATAAFTAAEVTDRQKLADLEQQINDKLAEQKKLREESGSNTTDGNFWKGTTGPDSTPIGGSGGGGLPEILQKGGAGGGMGNQAGGFVKAVQGQGFNLNGASGLGDSANPFSGLQEAIGNPFVLPKAGSAQAGIGAELAAILAKLGISPSGFADIVGGKIGTTSDDAQIGTTSDNFGQDHTFENAYKGKGGANHIVLTFRGEDDFGRMVAKNLSRGQALGTSPVRINVGNEG